MLTIRLQRRGRKNDPSFRVILVEAKRAAKTGNVNEILGNYDARSSRIDLKAERIKYWISQGVTVSDTVHNLLISNKVIEGKKINVLPRKSPPKKDEPQAAAAPAAVAPTTPEQAAAPEEIKETAEGVVDASPAAEVKVDEDAKGDNAVEA